MSLLDFTLSNKETEAFSEVQPHFCDNKPAFSRKLRGLSATPRRAGNFESGTKIRSKTCQKSVKSSNLRLKTNPSTLVNYGSRVRKETRIFKVYNEKQVLCGIKKSQNTAYCDTENDYDTEDEEHKRQAKLCFRRLEFAMKKR